MKAIDSANAALEKLQSDVSRKTHEEKCVATLVRDGAVERRSRLQESEGLPRHTSSDRIDQKTSRVNR